MTETKDLRGPALARAVLDHIEDLERRKAAGERTFAHWDQGDWGYVIEPGQARDGISCGTSMCFAGWACSLAEVPMKVYPARFYRPGDPARLGVDDGTPYGVSIANTAAKLLQLPTAPDDPEEYCDALFEAYNNLDDLRRMVAELEDGTYEDAHAWWKDPMSDD